MNQKVYMVCGVPASGKTWVLNQLRKEFTVIENDEFIGKTQKALVERIAKSAHFSPNPILFDCPFGETKLREELLRQGLTVIPLFIVEKPEMVRARYEKREKKDAPQNVLTRASTIKDRAIEWGAFFGTSLEVLSYLKAVHVAHN